MTALALAIDSRLTRRVWRCAEFRVEIQHGLHKALQLHSDSIVLQHAQPDQVKTIAYLLAQTVALHFYEM